MEKDILSIALEILQAKYLDLEVAAITGELITTDARLNLWFSGPTSAKKIDTDEKVLNILETHEDCIVTLDRAAQRFLTERARDELISVEKDIIERLKAAMAEP